MSRVHENEEEAVHLYRAYAEGLRVAREVIREDLWQYHRKGLDDIEGELTYLLVRERRPEVVVEIGERASAWIDLALHDNGMGELRNCRPNAAIPADATWVFIDEWCRPNLAPGTLGSASTWMAGLRRAQTPPGATPGTAGYNPGIRPYPSRPQPTPEPRLAPTPTSTQALIAVRGDRRLRRDVRRALAAAGVTPLTAADPDTRERLVDLKRKLRISAPISHSQANPTLFYQRP